MRQIFPWPPQPIFFSFLVGSWICTCVLGCLTFFCLFAGVCPPKVPPGWSARRRGRSAVTVRGISQEIQWNIDPMRLPRNIQSYVFCEQHVKLVERMPGNFVLLIFVKHRKKLTGPFFCVYTVECCVRDREKRIKSKVKRYSEKEHSGNYFTLTMAIFLVL